MLTATRFKLRAVLNFNGHSGFDYPYGEQSYNGVVHSTLPVSFYWCYYPWLWRISCELSYRRSVMERALHVVTPVTLVVLSVVSPVSLQAQIPKSFLPPTIMTVSSVSSGMCLQPTVNKLMDVGAAIVQEPCMDSPEQIWVSATPYGLHGLYLMNGLSGLCLDALGPAHNETPVQWPCAEPEGKIQILSEHWEAVGAVGTDGTPDKGILESSESSVFGASKDCLDTRGNTTPGVAIQIYSCNNTASQQWRFNAQLTPVPPAPPPIEIRSVLDGMCLQPMNKSMVPGAAIIQQACTGLPEQIWFWTTQPNGVSHLMNGLSGLCLDARGAAQNETPVQQWACPDPGQLQISNENWEAVGSSNKETLKSLVSGASKYCLDVPEGNKTPGVAMWIYGCNSTASQTWQFQSQSPPPGTLTPPTIEISNGSLLGGMCLQPINKSMEAGAAIVQQACTGLPEQIWIWMALPNGVSHLMNGLSGLCLDARGAAQNETPVQQWPCNQISNENWEVVVAPGTPDKEILKSRVSGTNNYCLYAPGASTPGTAVKIYTCNSSVSQIWQFGGQPTVVPNVFGWQTGTAATWIEGFSLVPQMQLPASRSMCNANTAGRVVGEVPAPGTPALRSSAVNLYFCPSS